MTPISVSLRYLPVSLRKYHITAAPVTPAQLAANRVGEFSIE
jgi:hypothetical protein